MRDSPLEAGDRQPEPSVRLRWFETLLLTAALPSLRLALGWADPFLCRGTFLWLSVVPLVVGVQHGLVCAIVSAGLLCAGASAEALMSSARISSPELGVACCAIAAVAGRARDARLEQCERLRRHVAALERVTERERTSRHVLQLSHERLAQQLAQQSGETPHSVQASVEAAVQRVQELQSLADVGRVLLELLADQADLQAGLLFISDGDGRLMAPAVASLGSVEGGIDAAEDMLVTRAFRTRRLVSVVDAGVTTADRMGAGTTRPSGGVLAALPLLAADARALGVIAIVRMPFEAFHPSGLRQSFVLASRVAGSIELERWERWASERGGVAHDLALGRNRDPKWGEIA